MITVSTELLNDIVEQGLTTEGKILERESGSIELGKDLKISICTSSEMVRVSWRVGRVVYIEDFTYSSLTNKVDVFKEINYGK